MKIPLPPALQPTNEMLMLIAAIDEFKGEWRALGNLGPETLRTLRRIATIESAGSSTRIEGAKLSDGEIEQLVGRLGKESFQSRDEQEVAGYASRAPGGAWDAEDSAGVQRASPRLGGRESTSGASCDPSGRNRGKCPSLV